MEETGLPSEKIGIVYISPCPSKVSYVQAPMGVEKSEIDEVLGIKDIYRILLPYLKEAQKEVQPLRQGGSIGIGWGLPAFIENSLYGQLPVHCVLQPHSPVRSILQV